MNKYLVTKLITSLHGFMLALYLCSCNHVNNVNSDERFGNITDQLTEHCIHKTGEFYHIDQDGWRLDTGFIRNYKKVVPGIINYVTKNSGDTIYWHSFILEISDKDTIYNPVEFYKRYESNGFQHILLLGKGSDTLFYYQAALLGDLRKIFIQGRYYYMYKFHELNREQRDFFEKHIDSLTHVRGHNLPPF